MTNKSKVRERVSKAYAKAVSKTGRSCCAKKKQPCSTIAATAGYSDKERELSADASSKSFGCGNPLAFSKVKEGDVILDLGAGAGFDLLIASQKVGSNGHVIGIDMTDAMIETARKNIKEAGATNVEVRKGIIEDLPVDSSSVDWVISNCVINLSPEKPKVFAEISRVLKPGGQMLVSDIVVKNLPKDIQNSEALYNSCVAGAISEEKYIEGLQKSGLEDVKVLSRLVYEKKQLKWFIESDELGECCCKKSMEGMLDNMVGNVWSAEFSARKPE